ncbi:MAG: carbohydrate ABC transporter permease [Rhodobiaceae bacterium]|nr:carbohydrate ABC transporter permease [Rhodobiaceae bacterium]
MTDATRKPAPGWRERRRIAKEEAANQSGMDYLMSLPQRVVRVYIPLTIIVFVLLFPFYWMTITAIKPNEQLVDLNTVNPYLVVRPTFDHIYNLLFNTPYLHWMWNTMWIALASTVLSLIASVLAAYAIVRLRYKGAETIGGLIFLAYLVPPSILFIPLSLMVVKYGLWDTSWALILTYPTILIPFSTWLLMGYFKSIPFELEECALIDGASRWQILTRIVLPLAGPGLISAGIFCFTLCWNEFIYALTFISSPAKKTVPVAILSEMVDGDVYRWGSLMAGALFGSVPVAIIYMFFVNHYVAAMTGAVKE